MSETGGYPEDVAASLGEDIPERSEQLDQVQPDDSLEDRGVDDVLDEGFTTPERWSVEERGDQGDGSMDERLDEEIPEDAADSSGDVRTGESGTDQDTTPGPEPGDDQLDDGQVGDERAGRLVDEDEGIDTDTESDLVGSDVGVDAAGAGAEEAAVHVVPETDDEEGAWPENAPRDRPH